MASMSVGLSEILSQLSNEDGDGDECRDDGEEVRWLSVVCRGGGGDGDGVRRREDEDHGGCRRGSTTVMMKTVVVVAT
ncbi:hypothetical protein TIFTF001_032603 [Ficus carica]|uniref:Uncharacterized protein n=1 Tax=Ficus carica TaxID=3494 RepID=A0AA88J6P4_FICCA|nr:hypothetical protein TIFTF001_032603 [Ficus carica]